MALLLYLSNHIGRRSKMFLKLFNKEYCVLCYLVVSKFTYLKYSSLFTDHKIAHLICN